MRDWAFSLADLRDRHPVGNAVAAGVLSGLLFGGYVWLLEGSFGIGVFGGCFFAIFMTPFYVVMIRRQGRFFPPGLDRESRVAVYRIVRTGAAVEDVALAPAVAHYAGAVLRIPHHPVFFAVAAGLVGLGAVFSLVAALQDSDPRHLWMTGFFLIMAVGYILGIVYAARRRRRAAQAYEWAQRLMATQG